jgi:methionyl-tRNA formyltransferase
MKKISNPFIFFGSGPVAADCLKLLVRDFTIEAVITKPNLPRIAHKSSVADIAKKHSLKLYELTNKQEVEQLFLKKSGSFKSKIGLIIDYGIILTQKVIDYFPLGIVNSHFSLLPEWRGPDPISFAVLSGQHRTGVSLMLIRAGVDEGPLLAQKTFHLTSTITTPELTQALINLSHQLLKTTLPRYIDGKLKAHEQAKSKPVTYSRKLTKEDGLIDWAKPAEQIEREIRAYAEWPKSYITLKRIKLIIIAGNVVNRSGKLGEIIIDQKRLIVCCGEKALEITKLKPAGKNIMSAEAFLVGYKDKLFN